MREMARFVPTLTGMAVMLAILGGSTASAAWTGYQGPPFPRWRTIPVPYYVNKSSYPPNIAELAELRIKAGFSSWSSPNCTFFDTELAGDLPNGTYSFTDGKNVVLWINAPNTWPQELGIVESVIGVTLPVAGSSGDLEDADIIFNNIGFCWYDFDPTNPGITCSGGKPVDTLSILTHEQGHFLGLGHTNVSGATMWPAVLPGNEMASLEEDDIEGVCGLYPLGGAIHTPGTEGARCDSCWENAPETKCLTSAKACTSSCQYFGDCLRECPINDAKAYEPCATQCSTQFNDGVADYAVFVDCMCNACSDACGMQCTGSSPCARPIPEMGNAGLPGDCPEPAFEGQGGCGCILISQDKPTGHAASLLLLMVVLAERRRRGSATSIKR